MDQTTIIVLAVVGSLGLLSAILGFSAEGTKLTLRDLLETEDGVCIYPENPALGLGICAAVFLAIAQVVVATVGGCYGCCKPRAETSESKRIVGIVCAIVSWVAAVVAFALLVVGAAWNSSAERDAPLYGYCPVLNGGVFAGGAVLTIVATGLGLTSYLVLRGQLAAAPAKTGGEKPPAGISMGQPQFPQPASLASSGQAPTRSPPPPPPPPPPPTEGGHRGQAPNQQQQLPSAPAQGYEPEPHNYPPPQGHEQV